MPFLLNYDKTDIKIGSTRISMLSPHYYCDVTSNHFSLRKNTLRRQMSKMVVKRVRDANGS